MHGDGASAAVLIPAGVLLTFIDDEQSSVIILLIAALSEINCACNILCKLNNVIRYICAMV